MTLHRVPRGRDGAEIEALLVDAYLDSLLAARDRRATDVPADPRLDLALRRAARRLDAELGRVHPSFRFEERLAAELQRRAAAMVSARTAGSPPAEPVVLELPASAAATPVDQAVRSDQPMRAPLLIGGAITSAAISIAGAYMAWRRGRPQAGPMARAVRAAHRGPARSLGLPLRTRRPRPVRVRAN